MLNVLFLIIIVLGVSGQSIVQKPYTNKVGGNGIYSFGTLLSTASLLFFVVTSNKLHFTLKVLPYSIGFATAYAAAIVFMVLSIAYGSLSLTSLFVSYSLMIPTFYGILVLHDSVSGGFIFGLILLAISLFLVNITGEKAKISLKWGLCVFVSFLGNGMCTVVQKMQQVASKGAYKNEFMIMALGIVAVVMAVLTVMKERRNIKTNIKAGWYLALICGVLNGAVNLLVMILSGRMPVSIMFPLISAGGLIITYIVSRFVYKEKLTKTQLVGFVFGLGSVVLLSI